MFLLISISASCYKERCLHEGWCFLTKALLLKIRLSERAPPVHRFRENAASTLLFLWERNRQQFVKVAAYHGTGPRCSGSTEGLSVHVSLIHEGDAVLESVAIPVGGIRWLSHIIVLQGDAIMKWLSLILGLPTIY